MAGEQVSAKFDTVFPSPTARLSWQARGLLTFYRHVVKKMLPAHVGLPEAKAMMVKLDRWLGGRGGDNGFERQSVRANGLSAEWINPRGSSTKRVILYLHGGGFMLSTPHLHGRLAARLCKLLGARAFMPHYRLAPDHPLPAAHEDCLAAYRWLIVDGHDAANIILIGDSAGGMLVLSTLQRIRDAGLPLPACGVMFSPGSCVDSMRELDAKSTLGDPMIGPGMLDLLQRVVVSQVGAYDPAISPCAGSLHGLPPLLFQAGSTEMLLFQSRKAFALARAGGTYAELQVWPEMPHVWQAVHWLPEAEQALACVADFVTRLGGADWQGIAYELPIAAALQSEATFG